MIQVGWKQIRLVGVLLRPNTVPQCDNQAIYSNGNI